MMKSKTVLMVVSILVLLMGVLGLPQMGLDYGSEPTWHAALKILVGLVGLYVGYTDKS
jgi:succinate dehydrogenase hydrophobic anchor subunit